MMSSCDHIVMHIDTSSLRLMLRLLTLDPSLTIAPSGDDDDDEICRTRARLHDIVQQTGQQHASALTLDNMTVSRTQALLHLCSCLYLEGWWRGTVVERRSLAGELPLSCARPAADG